MPWGLGGDAWRMHLRGLRRPPHALTAVAARAPAWRAGGIVAGRRQTRGKPAQRDRAAATERPRAERPAHPSTRSANCPRGLGPYGTRVVYRYQGEPGGYVRRYSDNLLMFRLKGELPQKYAERLELRGGLATLNMDALPDELLERIARGEHPMAVLSSALERGISAQKLGLLPSPEDE